ncbi:hypothetical protein MSAN_00819800 [Mycena sanguinolenta]|uniref:Uncharacterized protein n=1 Tax=Mycena sanguinolenta TaxID=230812 RepID=A0A8H6YZ02_9AGAR|nr:hypothetical protein MSAN_00819800 [Mycena sanguinolenta]
MIALEHPERPATAMSGIEELCDRRSQEDVYMTESVNVESTAQPETEEQVVVLQPEPPLPQTNQNGVVPELPVDGVDSLGLASTNRAPNPDVTAEKAAVVVPAVQHFDRDIGADEDEDKIVNFATWFFLIFDREVDVDKYDPKVIIVDLTKPGSVHMFRLNALKLQLEVNRPEVDEHNNIMGLDCEAPAVSRTYNVYTRYLLRTVLDVFWPRKANGFEIYWRLPGFMLQDDLGPIAMVHDAAVGAKARLRCYVCRMVLVLRPLHKLRASGPEVRLEPDPKILLRYSPEEGEKVYFTASESQTSSSSSSDTSKSSSDSSSDSESSSSPAPFNQANPPSPVPIPALPSSPASAADNTARINQLTLRWLESKYATPLYPVVLQIRVQAEREKRHKRKVSQLCAWAAQVKSIMTDQTHVPILPETGIAGNHKINQGNLAALFMRTTSWISQAIKAHDFIEANKHRVAVATFLQTDRVFGLKTFQEELCKL